MQMTMRSGHFVLAIAIAMAGARAAVAQETDAVIIETVLRFIDALQAGDAEALEQTIAAETTAHERTRKVWIELALSQKGLEKAAIRRFGEEGKKFGCGFDLIVSGNDRKTIANARVRWIEPSTAQVERPGDAAPMEVRRSPRRGVWQVVLEPIESETEDLDMYQNMPYAQPGTMRQIARANIRNKLYADISRAFRETTARIENGQLTGAAAAHAELVDKLTAASAAAAKARAAIPSRMRERSGQ